MSIRGERGTLTSARWRKSTRSNEMGGECVEVAAVWRKSRHGSDMGGAGVENAGAGPAVAVRDSKNPEGAKLFVSPDGWAGLLGDIRRGAYDRPRRVSAHQERPVPLQTGG
ncbi:MULTISPECIES: DUF397 domain-containing protein [Thermomonospora]|uniref:DUF397 domain-containing protein n=1 Tax=Thermomonospora curvata (strain ATCC 19995 / DSM 43183 / JCM 3096 / KCTC 9072 / NBRC 15933 / NCIMB 10081 / Henssen B9) TaxID=471852 RepID=D1AEW8_THECD|nr:MULTISPECIES: DUF397 domain-containing protein [Thermomonospora]ACY97693.1 protein of unknown function DUF397 [Thermomonospora curvata DSM 43183]PKK14436.1 MAG: DUF397 domain-containing protein [Thermomonospora sp. CIF 1]TNY35349.1 DUF397 domain-containing protein [Thermomonospora catenispora]